MEDKTGDKIAISFFIFCCFIGLFVIGMFAWGFIEMVGWITSK
jgi:hypothetical protein